MIHPVARVMQAVCYLHGTMSLLFFQMQNFTPQFLEVRRDLLTLEISFEDLFSPTRVTFLWCTWLFFEANERSFKRKIV